MKLTNPLAVDPTRMSMVHRAFQKGFTTRLAKVQKQAAAYLQAASTKERWQWLSVPDRIHDFQSKIKTLMKEMLDEGPWWEELIARAYIGGVERAYDDVRKPLLQPQGVRAPLKRQYVQDAIRAPNFTILEFSVNAPKLPPRDEWGRFMTQKAHELSERLAKGWRRQADLVSQQIARTVRKGIDEGLPPELIATNIRALSTGIPIARATAIARTEVTRAHAEGQLDSYSTLGVKAVTGIAEVEIVTAGDGKVCQRCLSLIGRSMPVEAARGIIPVHTHCRCAWKMSPPKLLTQRRGNVHRDVAKETCSHRISNRAPVRGRSGPPSGGGAQMP